MNQNGRENHYLEMNQLKRENQIHRMNQHTRENQISGMNNPKGENKMKQSIKTPPLPQAVKERLTREASKHLSRDNAEEKSLRALCHAFLDKHVIK